MVNVDVIVVVVLLFLLLFFSGVVVIFSFALTHGPENSYRYIFSDIFTNIFCVQCTSKSGKRHQKPKVLPRS